MLAEHLAGEIARAEASGTSVALVFLDLDDFKSVNDRLGHGVGDQLLFQLAGRLQRLVRGGDLLARHGGDEFLLVMSGLRNTPARTVRRVRDALSAALREPLTVGGHELRMTASIGFSIYPDDGDGPDQLLARADAAMYREKRRRASQ